jgi:hypothetical protein
MMRSALRALIPRPARKLLRTPLIRLEQSINRLQHWRLERKRIHLRRGIAEQYYQRPLDLIDSWSRLDTELSNFNYELTALNRAHLAGFVAVLTKATLRQVENVFLELDNDDALRQHVARSMSELEHPRDARIAYGRRLGWYAIVRLKKPRVVIETGVDEGMGSCILCAGLMRNAAEGHPGRYYGTEIRDGAGKLLADPYSKFGEVIYGDSITTLRAFEPGVDLFINDSDHSGEYEYREYQTITVKLSPDAIVLGDNSHVTDSLYRFAQDTGRAFLFFRETPRDHWYPGAGIGCAFDHSTSI